MASTNKATLDHIKETLTDVNFSKKIAALIYLAIHGGARRR